MKNCIAAVGLALICCCAAQAQEIHLSETNDVRTVNPLTGKLELYQCTAYRYDVAGYSGTTPIALTNTDIFALWWIQSKYNPTHVVMVATGTVLNATNGQVRFEVDSQQMNVAPSNYYSFVRAYRATATETSRIATLSFKDCTVQRVADSGGYQVNPPLGYPVQVALQLMTNEFISNLNTASNALNIVITNVAGNLNVASNALNIALTNTAANNVTTSNRAEAAYTLADAAPTYAEASNSYVLATGESRAITLGGALTVTGKTIFGTACSAGGDNAAVHGGINNSAEGNYSVVAGGLSNMAAAYGAALGGTMNAAGLYSSVPGGFSNSAAGQQAFAFGSRATATNTGSLVWGDAVNAVHRQGGGENSATFHASGGFYHMDGTNILSSSDGALSMNGVAITSGTVTDGGGATNVIPGSANSYDAATRTWTWSTNENYALAPGSTFKPGTLSVKSGRSSILFDNSDVNIGAANAAYSGGGGIAIGTSADGTVGGIAIGYNAAARTYGAAYGSYTKANNYGTAIGSAAEAAYGPIGTNYGVAIGTESLGQSYNVAVGAFAKCTRGGGFGRTALGVGVTNSVAETVKVRGALYVWQPTRLDAHPTPATNTLIIYTIGTNSSGYAMNEAGIAAKITAHNEYGDDLRVTYDDRTGVERTVNETLRDELMVAALTESPSWAEYRDAALAAYEKSVTWQTSQPPRNDREQAKMTEREQEITAWDAVWADSPSTNKPPRPEPYKPVIVPPRPVRPKAVER